MRWKFGLLSPVDLTLRASVVGNFPGVTAFSPNKVNPIQSIQCAVSHLRAISSLLQPPLIKKEKNKENQGGRQATSDFRCNP